MAVATMDVIITYPVPLSITTAGKRPAIFANQQDIANFADFLLSPATPIQEEYGDDADTPLHNSPHSLARHEGEDTNAQEPALM